MNRNFLTAFCIVALVGLSCPIVAKMACPVDEYFNQELQLVTGDNVPYQFFITSQPVSVSTPFIYSVKFRCAVQYTKNVDDLRFTWFIKRSGSTSFSRFGADTLGSYFSDSSSFNSNLYSGMSIYCSVTDGTTTLQSDVVTLFYTGSSKSIDSDTKGNESEVYYDFQIGGENDEKSEVIDEPKRKEEDIEESETELSEDTEIIE